MNMKALRWIVRYCFMFILSNTASRLVHNINTFYALAGNEIM